MKIKFTMRQSIVKEVPENLGNKFLKHKRFCDLVEKKIEACEDCPFGVRQEGAYARCVILDELDDADREVLLEKLTGEAFNDAKWDYVKGRGHVAIVDNDRQRDDFDSILGKMVNINGREYKVIGIEKFAINLPYREGMPFGMLIEGEV